MVIVFFCRFVRVINQTKFISSCKKKLLSSVALASCSLNTAKYQSELPELPSLELNNPYEYIGELHNKGLDYVKMNLSNTRSIHTEDPFGVIDELSEEFVEKVVRTDSRFMHSKEFAVLRADDSEIAK